MKFSIFAFIVLLAGCEKKSGLSEEIKERNEISEQIQRKAADRTLPYIERLQVKPELLFDAGSNAQCEPKFLKNVN
jgi:hypothetical protein